MTWDMTYCATMQDKMSSASLSLLSFHVALFSCVVCRSRLTLSHCFSSFCLHLRYYQPLPCLMSICWPDGVLLCRVQHWTLFRRSLSMSARRDGIHSKGWRSLGLTESNPNSPHNTLGDVAASGASSSGSSKPPYVKGSRHDSSNSGTFSPGGLMHLPSLARFSEIRRFPGRERDPSSQSGAIPVSKSLVLDRISSQSKLLRCFLSRLAPERRTVISLLQRVRPLCFHWALLPANVCCLSPAVAAVDSFCLLFLRACAQAPLGSGLLPRHLTHAVIPPPSGVVRTPRLR